MFTAIRAVIWTSVVFLVDARSPRQSNDVFDDEMNIKMLGISVPGTPGEDYPILAKVPSTSFSCDDKLGGGYYADVETGCQAYHTCGTREDLGLITYSNLCPNGTIFDQGPQTCRWWYLVDCQASEDLYFSDNNIRGSNSDGSSSNTQESSFTFSQNTVSSSSNSQSNRGNDNNIYVPVPESVLREQFSQRTRNNVAQQQPKQDSSNRRTSTRQRTSTTRQEGRKTANRNNGAQRPNISINARRGQNPSNSQRETGSSTRRETTRVEETKSERSGQSGRNGQNTRRTENTVVEENYDYYSFEEGSSQATKAATLPPTNGDFSFVGKLKASRNG